MPAMQFASRTENCHVHADTASRAESDELTPRLVHRSIAHEPDITGEQFLVGGQRFLEIWRPGFLFSLKCKLDVRFRLQTRGAYRIHGREHRDDGRLIVGRAASVQTPLRVELSTRRRQRDYLAISLELLLT